MAPERQRTDLLDGGVMLAATALAVAGWFLPWVAFHSDGQLKQLSPAIVWGAFHAAYGTPASSSSVPLTAVLLVVVLVCFGVALTLILLPEVARRSIAFLAQLSQTLSSHLLACWCIGLVLINVTLVWLMWLFLAFDDADTGATNFGLSVGLFCTLASIAVAGGYRFWARQLERGILRMKSSRW
jgi:hypothetical protein